MGDNIGDAYVNIGDRIGTAYLKVSCDLNTPCLGQNGPFPSLFSHKHEFSSQRHQNTPSFIQIVQELSLEFQNKNPSSSRFNHGFSKQIEDLEYPQRRLQEEPIIFTYRDSI
ncbi:hypothetical protein P3S67_017374 [Capsicum chacoense]